MIETSNWGPTMTVSELIVALSKIEDQNLPLISEGCDCVGPVRGVVVSSNYVELSRSE